jgi:hypothetical protein
MLRALYAAVSPDGPEHFDVVFDKIACVWRADPGIDFAQLDLARARRAEHRLDRVGLEAARVDLCP